MYFFRGFIKPLITQTIYPVGAIRRILRGPSKGLCYRIFPRYGWSPLYGGWEPREQSLLTKYIRPGFVTYDIGANYGIHTMLMARLVKPVGQVYAFEPMPRIFSALQENVSLNNFTNVSCSQIAVGDYVGEAEFLIGPHDGAGKLSNNQGSVLTQKIAVDVTTLDELVFKRNYRPPNLIKIDVEGAESKVLYGALQVLHTFGPILLVELHNPEQDVAVGNILAQCGYRAFRIGEQKEISNLNMGWPDPNGLWGTFIAVHTN